MCRSYAVSAVPGTNLFLLVIDATCICDVTIPLTLEAETVPYIFFAQIAFAP